MENIAAKTTRILAHWRARALHTLIKKHFYPHDAQTSILFHHSILYAIARRNRKRHNYRNGPTRTELKDCVARTPAQKGNATTPTILHNIA